MQEGIARTVGQFNEAKAFALSGVAINDDRCRGHLSSLFEKIEKILIDREPGRREEMMTRTNRRTVPQIYIDERHIGGFDDLSALDREGGLVPLLAA